MLIRHVFVCCGDGRRACFDRGVNKPSVLLLSSYHSVPHLLILYTMSAALAVHRSEDMSLKTPPPKSRTGKSKKKGGKGVVINTDVAGGSGEGTHGLLLNFDLESTCYIHRIASCPVVDLL